MIGFDSRGVRKAAKVQVSGSAALRIPSRRCSRSLGSLRIGGREPKMHTYTFGNRNVVSRKQGTASGCRLST
jgi:hypothetical protein